MAVFGLTGGIGAGKSTVCGLLQELGVPVVAADDVGRQVVAPGSAGLAQIVAAFGPEILDRNGALDRRQLGALVFADPARRRQLEDIMHPLVKQHSQALFAQLSRAGVPLLVYESALLFETERQHEMQGTIVVTASEAQRLARVQQRDGVTPAQVLARMQAQMDVEEKCRLADYVIDNSGDEQTLRQAVAALVRQLRQTQEGQPGPEA
ncbi:MAG: dephospho-CoA kinase [Candidatus Tectimicrobiota bacterium]